mmetsp:Transcript_96216/g.206507  ORF Transcript_96216/g.206507 Transcript_96216/m.206507 type:complete len:244 (+) Transcript_96216:660-1391(+)
MHHDRLAEIDEAEAAIVGDEQVLQGYVAVCDTRLVQRLEGLEHLGDHLAEHLLALEAASALEHCEELAVRAILRGEVEVIAILSESQNLGREGHLSSEERQRRVELILRALQALTTGDDVPAPHLLQSESARSCARQAPAAHKVGRHGGEYSLGEVDLSVVRLPQRADLAPTALLEHREILDRTASGHLEREGVQCSIFRSQNHGDRRVNPGGPSPMQGGPVSRKGEKREGAAMGMGEGANDG